MGKVMKEGEFSALVGGLKTDLSLLNAGPNNTLDEVNMVLEPDGSRRRRLGLADSGLMSNPAKYADISNVQAPATVYSWDVGGKILLVVGLEGNLCITEAAPSDTSNAFIKISYQGSVCSITSNSTELYVVNGDKTVLNVTYDESVPFDPITFQNKLRYRSFRIKSRDFWGVDTTIAHYSPADFSETPQVNKNPTISNLTSQELDDYIYNLRNQGFLKAYIKEGGTDLYDPIKAFTDKYSGVLPSMSAVIASGVRKDATAGNPYVDRYYSGEMQLDVPQATRAPMGAYVIDLLDRGASRKTEYEQGKTPDVTWSHPTINTLTDSTITGATKVCSFNGRLFFGGFGSQITDSTSHSPNLSSYIFFSRVIRSPSDCVKCYQNNDPTDPIAPDVLADDGGFILIPECSKVMAIKSLGSSIIVLCSNGVWAITGTDVNGFTATSFEVKKISEEGCISEGSCVSIENILLYWSKSGIYAISQDTNQVESITNGVISTLISDFLGRELHSAYDQYSKKIYWTACSPAGSLLTGNTLELVFSITEKSFAKNFYKSPYRVVNIPRMSCVSSLKRNIKYTEVAYCSSTTIATYFSICKDETFKDGSNDAAAYLVSGYLHSEGISRQKQSPYLYFYLLKTEDGFTVDGEGDATGVKHESSCIVQSMWDWNNTDSGGKWGRPFQAYRHRRQYISSGDPSDTYDTGESVVATRNKLPGRGRTVNVKISTEPLKDLIFLGWSVSINTDEAP